MSETLLLACLGFLLATYAGYPLVMLALAWIVPRPVRSSQLFRPTVTCVVAAHDEGERLVRKVGNLLAQEWPQDRLEVVIADDASTDGSAARARALDPARVRVVTMPVRSGKPSALQRAVVVASGEVLVLCDARQRFDPDAVARLVEPLADAEVGAATGRLLLEGGGPVGLYWRYESALRRFEGEVGSVMGVTGATYAIRRSLFPREMPADTVLDDVYVPMSVVLRGRRVVYAHAARAYDPELAVRDELPRKIRTLAGNYQLLALMPELLVPWRNPAFMPFFMHKVARLACPWALLGAFLASAAAPGALHTVAFALQLALYGLALLPVLRPGARTGALTRFCHAFVMLHLAAVAGLWRFLRGQASAAWSPTSGRHPNAAR